jgi:hypothetical protein
MPAPRETNADWLGATAHDMVDRPASGENTNISFRFASDMIGQFANSIRPFADSKNLHDFYRSCTIKACKTRLTYKGANHA